jgi:hypothetical protein
VEESVVKEIGVKKMAGHVIQRFCRVTIGKCYISSVDFEMDILYTRIDE